MFRNSPGIEQLSADLQKKSRQIDMLESTISKLNTDLEASKKQVTDLRKVCFICFRIYQLCYQGPEGKILVVELENLT